MAVAMFDFLKSLIPGTLEQIVFPSEVREILNHLSTDLAPPAGPQAAPISGNVKASANDSAGGFASLDIDPLGPEISFDMRVLGPAANPIGFQLDLKPADGLLKLPAGCAPAKVQPDGRMLVADPTAGGRVKLTLNGADPLAIRIEGSIGQPARQGIVALDAAESGVLSVGTNPAAFFLGAQGFGLHLAGGLTVDSSSQNAPAPVTGGVGGPAPSATSAWQGVAIRNAELFLPPDTPLVGAGPIPVELDLGMPNGLYGRTEAHVAENGPRPAFDATIVWDDPGATSLASALPAMVEIRTSWNLDTAADPSGVGNIELLGGRPLRVTARFARKPGTSDFDLGLVVEAGGDQGLLSVKGSSAAGKVVVTAAALATAFIADANPPSASQPKYDGFGATLHALLVAAAGLSAFLDDGNVVVHAVEIDAGLGSAGTKLTLRVDYSVDVMVKTIDLGFMSIGMKPRVPMRLRYRNVRLLVDFVQTGLERFHLSFGEADVDVEDPGGWQVQSPGTLKDLFDVLGSRSGRGSQWFEVDLRFALELGPVKVSGATVRVTLGANGPLDPELRGLDASMVMPGLFEASGKASLGAGQLDLALAAKIVPLNVAAFASVTYVDCGEGINELLFALGVDLPGPIPLANSGLGLYGLGGIFGVNSGFPSPAPNADPIDFYLGQNPLKTSLYTCLPGNSIFGLGAVVGTAPDLGFTFSAKGVVVIGVPDFALRASLQGRVLSPRVMMTEEFSDAAAGLSFKGVLAVEPSAVTLAMRGQYKVPFLLTIDVPFGARFPKSGRNWFVRLGSDGQQGRGPGPIQANILPGILPINAWAFFMMEGDGIPSLGGVSGLSPTGFALGFGAGFTAVYGIPLIHLDVSASVILALGTRPLLLGGLGHLSGSLHLGPVSIGASADISFLIAPDLGDNWVKFEVCGEVDLFFFSLEGCVTIELGEKGSMVPDPQDWPLESIALADHRYTKLADAVRSPTRPPIAELPTVWPDVIPILQFTNGPANGLQAGPFKDKLSWNAAAVGAGVVGNDRLSYTYTLTSLALTEINPHTGAETVVAGPLEAAWQQAKAGALGEPGARELALLTWESHLWTRKLVDGAANDPNDPIPAIPNRCHDRYFAKPGWALGGLGNRHAPGDSWQLPTEPQPGPFASVFSVAVATEWWGVQIDVLTTPMIPLGFPLRLPAPFVFRMPIEGMGRSFDGALDLLHVVDLPLDRRPDEIARGIGEVPVHVMLSFSEPLRDIQLALHLPLWPPGMADRLRVTLFGPNGTILVPMVGEDRPGIGDSVVRGYEQAGGPFTALQLEYHAALAPQVLGVCGVTESEAQAADAATKATNTVADDVAKKATAVKPRAMLKPDRIYRIDAGFNGKGQREGTAGNDVPHDESYWFRTADMSGPAPSKGKQYLQRVPAAEAVQHYKEFVFAPAVHQRKDRFDPVYLERYILSWMPQDKSRHWFLDDPVGVQLEVNHVPDLAAAYDHDTVVRVHRTDPTKGRPDPFEVQDFGKSNIWQAAVSLLHPESDLRLHAASIVAGACPYPSPGATLGGRPKLQPLSDYELSLAFPFLDSANSGLTGGTTIRGGVFGTSRYATPNDLLADLGFGTGTLAGDIEVKRFAAGAGDVTADGAVQRALGALGLGRLAPVREARSIALWTKVGPAWALHGVLLEAPEPIHRPDALGLANFGGRIKVNAMRCGGNAFEAVLRSSSGDRLLFLTGNPFAPAASLNLAVTMQSIPLESTTAAADGVFACPISASPAFAEDLT
ncbi:hypothetical protein EN820_46775 [bacterium M00.F.Ca.ET.177.01.1.1]|nr:hypothetical protein EN820_46775 [bacterium M00.F.Ca.ET.177.01.1.1]